jgi:hypothetical protein
MKCYFVRHAPGLGVIDECVRDLYNHDLIAIHFPLVPPGTPIEIEDTRSMNPNDYTKRWAKTAIKTMNELSEFGGYIWAEYRTSSFVKIGEIIPQPVQYLETMWRPGTFPYKRKAILRALKMKKVKRINPNEEKYRELNKAKPRQVALCRWPAAKCRLSELI